MNKLGLYLHVPFCRRKCAYCDFYSGQRLSLIPDYVQALARAIANFARRMSEYTIDTVYLGGGTPSLLGAEGIEQVFDALRAHMPLLPDAEITVEANPESVTPAFLAACRKAGVNRVSIGMQSASDRELKILGRLHSAADTRRAVALCREAGIKNVSLDLMYGLPGQTPDEFLESVLAAIREAPEHLSFYCLTLDESVPLYAHRSELPDDEILLETYLKTVDLLRENGYIQYEISNAAKPGYYARHNAGYWRGKEYLGIGPGAASYFQGERFLMKADVDAFLSATDFDTLIIDREPITPEKRAEEYLILSLRETRGIDLNTYQKLAGKGKREAVEKALIKYEQTGFAEKTPAGFCLTPRGFFVSNTILSDLI